MARRRWTMVLAATPLLVASSACSDDDDPSGATAAGSAATVTATDPAPPAPSSSSTPPPTTAPLTTTAPSLTTPASVITDTEAVGGSTLSTVDLASGAATSLGAVGAELGVLGAAVDADGTIIAVTDAPGLLVLDPRSLPPDDAPAPLDAGATLLALARRPSDGALFAVDDGGGVVRVDPATATATPVAEVVLDDPGVGLDVTADGTLEVVVATGARFAVDPDSGDVSDLPALSADEAPPRIVAVAHDLDGRYGLDASTDELVLIADDGTVDTIGPLGLDVTDGASLDIGADGVAVLVNPG